MLGEKKGWQHEKGSLSITVGSCGKNLFCHKIWQEAGLIMGADVKILYMTVKLFHYAGNAIGSKHFN